MSEVKPDTPKHELRTRFNNLVERRARAIAGSEAFMIHWNEALAGIAFELFNDNAGQLLALHEVMQQREAHGEARLLAEYKLAAAEGKVRELELTLAGAIQRGGELIAERDAALKARDEAADQVVVLRDAILPIYAPSLDGIGNPCICPNTGQGRNIESAITNTSALAAQRKREIQGEAVEAAIKGVLANFVYGCKDSELPAMIRAGAEKGAAILDTTEALDARALNIVRKA